MKRLLYLTMTIGIMTIVSPEIIEATKLTVSVVIPCVPKHAPHLLNLLSHYARQTVLPQEVVISLSRIDCIPRETIDQLSNTQWPFKLILIRNVEQTSAGKNRNLGVEAVTGDIVMFQDADDIPHPQRVEIVMYFFETYPIYHLMHFYVMPKKMENHGEVPPECVAYQKDKIAFKMGACYQETSDHYPFSNGEPCVLRSIASKIMWPDQYTVAEDLVYSQRMYSQFPGKTIILEVPLVVYRNQLTSGWPSR